MAWVCQGCGESFATTLRYQVANTCKSCFGALSAAEQEELRTAREEVVHPEDHDPAPVHRVPGPLARGWVSLHITSRLLTVVALALVAWGVVMSIVAILALAEGFTMADVPAGLSLLVLAPIFEALFQAGVLVAGIGLIEVIRDRPVAP